MKSFLLGSLLLCLSTSLLASDHISPSARIEARRVAFGPKAADTLKTHGVRLEDGSFRVPEAALIRANEALKETLSSIDSNSSLAGVSEGEDDTSGLSPAQCLMHKVPTAYKGSPCLGNLYLGLLSLASNQCGLSINELKKARNECGLH